MHVLHYKLDLAVIAQHFTFTICKKSELLGHSLREHRGAVRDPKCTMFVWFPREGKLCVQIETVASGLRVTFREKEVTVAKKSAVRCGL